MSFLQSLQKQFDQRFGGQSASESYGGDAPPPYEEAINAAPELDPAFNELPDDRVNNWPSCKPVIHHNIGVDFPRHMQPLVRRLYLHCYFHTACYVWNFISVCAMLGAVCKENCVGGFFLGLLSLAVAPPVTFALYFSGYTGLRTESSFYHTIWLAGYSLMALNNLLFAIGFEKLGMAGVVSMMDAFAEPNLAVGAMMFVSTAMWIVDLAVVIYCIYSGRMAYNRLRQFSEENKFNSGVAPSSVAREPVRTVVLPEPVVSNVVSEPPAAAAATTSPLASRFNFDVIKGALSASKDLLTSSPTPARAEAGTLNTSSGYSSSPASPSYTPVSSPAPIFNKQQQTEAERKNKQAMEAVFGSN